MRSITRKFTEERKTLSIRDLNFNMLVSLKAHHPPSCFHQSLTYVKKNGLQREVVILVLELASGGELFDFMMYTGAFPEVVARTYFLQVRHGHAGNVFGRHNLAGCEKGLEGVDFDKCGEGRKSCARSGDVLCFFF